MATSQLIFPIVFPILCRLSRLYCNVTLDNIQDLNFNLGCMYNFGHWSKRGTTFSDMDADNWLVLAFFKIELWNFQDKLDLWFREASQNLSSFRQLFFHSFQGGTKGKMLKNCQNYTLFFSALETMKKKLSKWVQILRCFTKSKMKHMLKILAVYLMWK